MADFLYSQLDYIFFFYGLAFIILSAVCFTMGRRGDVPWGLLGAFGLLHGINEWLDLIAISVGDSQSFELISYLFLVSSFLFLVEFGRATTKATGRWVYLPLMVIAVSGGLSGLEGLKATTRYALGFVGGIWSSAALFAASKRQGPVCARKWLFVGGFSIALYALATGTITPYAPFFPASLFNAQVFLSITGMPIQLIRGVLAVLLASTIWACSQTPEEEIDFDEHKRRSHNAITPAVTLFILLVLGWLLTEAMGAEGKESRQISILISLIACSSAILYFFFRRLASESDRGKIGRLMRVEECLSNHLMLVGISLGLSIWLLDSLINTYVFKYGSFFEQFFYPDLDCLWMRSGVIGMLFSFGAYAQFNVRERGQAETRIKRQTAGRRMAEDALLSEKERLAVTLRSIGDGVITTDIGGRVTLINKVAEGLTGWTQEEAAGRPLADVFNIINEETRERCANPVEKVLSTGDVVGLANHTALISRRGKEHSIADSGAPIRDADNMVIGVVLVFRDITDERRMEAELTRSQRIESLGLIAGGIAHDFNNILTAILSNIYLARLSSAPEGKTSGYLTTSERAVHRAQALTQQLLTFSSGGTPVRKSSSLKAIIEESASFALRGSRVRCDYSLPADLWPVEADEGQISQVIHNLIINAEQSMPEGGVVSITAENVTIGKDSRIPLNEGRYAKVSVADIGMGVPPEHLSLIFDPYFTTKQKGRGLGLATAWSIIKKHDGHISVESKLREGTTFTIYLPASDTPAAGRAEEKAVLTGSGKILVMDDEEDIRNSIRDILSHFGYEAAFAENGETALRLYKESMSDRKFDAVILDLTVPGGMGGEETIKKIREIDPSVKALVSSGYSTNPVLANYKEHGFDGMVVKPYSPEQFLKTLAGVLRGQSG